MRRIAAVALFTALAWLVVAPGSAKDKDQQQTRTLTGQVTTRADAPIPNAVVYLKNTKTLAVKTFITDSSGGYRFPELSPNTDYEVYAEQDGVRSDAKTLSSFDSRTKPIINLKIGAGK